MSFFLIPLTPPPKKKNGREEGKGLNILYGDAYYAIIVFIKLQTDIKPQ